MKSVVIYVYYNSVPNNYNTRFFSWMELQYRKGVDYIIVINGFNYDKSIVFPILDNLIILKRDNIGYDFGGYNHALKYIKQNGITYDYYFFLNSGVIGPILPHYFKEHWTNIFIKKINNIVKLVGTTIVCLPHSDAGGYGPKVEGFFFMTDQIGLDLLQNEKTIFCNHINKYYTIVIISKQRNLLK